MVRKNQSLDNGISTHGSRDADVLLRNWSRASQYTGWPGEAGLPPCKRILEDMHPERAHARDADALPRVTCQQLQQAVAQRTEAVRVAPFKRVTLPREGRAPCQHGQQVRLRYAWWEERAAGHELKAKAAERLHSVNVPLSSMAKLFCRGFSLGRMMHVESSPTYNMFSQVVGERTQASLAARLVTVRLPLSARATTSGGETRVRAPSTDMDTDTPSS